MRAKGVYVDLSDPSRQKAMREAEYQSRLNAESKVLRVSGKTKPIAIRRIAAIVQRIKGTV